MTKDERGLVQFHISKIEDAMGGGPRVTLEEMYPSGDRWADAFLDGLWTPAYIGAEARESGPAVAEEAAIAVASALFVLNFGPQVVAEFASLYPVKL